MQIFTNPDTTMSQLYDLDPVVETLENGGSILYPTDTTWSIGCDATNPEAVEKLFALKQRERNRPFLLLVSSIEMLRRYVVYIHPRVETLLAYHERPLTIIYDLGKKLPSNALGADGSIGIRITQDNFCREMIERFGKPIIASSARIGTGPLPAHFGEISSSVIIGVNQVVRHRQLDKEMGESCVVARLGDDGEFEFLRE